MLVDEISNNQKFILYPWGEARRAVLLLILIKLQQWMDLKTAIHLITLERETET